MSINRQNTRSGEFHGQESMNSIRPFSKAALETLIIDWLNINSKNFDHLILSVKLFK